MADTHGFDVVLEAPEALLSKELRGAWKSAECPVKPGEQGRIPEFMDIPEDTSLNGYKVKDGQIQIPRSELEARMAPDVNGLEVKLGLHLQVEIKDPPVPSAGFFDMTADMRAKAPVGTLPGGLDVGILFGGLPIDNVSTTLTSGDPLAPKLDILMAEYVHKIYENWTPTGPRDPTFSVIPHAMDETNVSFAAGMRMSTPSCTMMTPMWSIKSLLRGLLQPASKSASPFICVSSIFMYLWWCFKIQWASRRGSKS